MTDTDNVAYADAQQTIRSYSDGELLAFWSATETAQDAATETASEASVIAVAAQELLKRGLLPR